MKYLLTLLVLISFVSIYAQATQVFLPKLKVESTQQPSWGMGISLSTFGPGLLVFYQLGKIIRIKGSGTTSTGMGGTTSTVLSSVKHS